MSFERHIAERLRAARPRVHGEPPPLASVLARIDADASARRNDAQGAARRIEAGDSARQIDADAPARRRGGGAEPRRGWRLRVALIVALSVIAIAGTAWGASLLLSGNAVVTGFPPAKSTVGMGAPLRSSDAVLGLRAGDPAGGLPWGMRIVRTSRGQACLQVGRILESKIGVLGSGYAFHGDGRFHPLSPEDALGERCVPEFHGRVFDVQGPMTVSADGLSLAENLLDRVHCDLPGQHDWGVRCPLSQLRVVAFGALGPNAAQLRVSYHGRSFNVRPYGPQGAYLLVFPAPAHTNVGYFGAQAPNPPVLTVRFADGSSCTLPQANDTDECRPQGIDLAAGPQVTAAELASPIEAVYERHLNVAEPTQPDTATSSHSSAAAPVERDGPALIATFNAPVAIAGPLSTYGVELTRPVVPGCFGGPLLVGQEVSPTLHRRQRTRLVVPLQRACHGVYRGRVFYASVAPSDEGPSEERLVSAITDQLIAVLHKGPPGTTVGRFTVDVPAGR